LQSANGDNFIQIETLNDTLKIYCIVGNPDLLEQTSSITTGTEVTIFGKCLRLKEDIFDPSFNSIYIETKSIK
jgi:hypothetical protein